jgi:Icc-related predicted phosphoesterase
VTSCLFVSDLHGRRGHYTALVQTIGRERPAAVFLGGDLLPSGRLPSPSAGHASASFIGGFLLPQLARLRTALGDAYPQVLLILGNDDPRSTEPLLAEGERDGLWQYLHGRKAVLAGFTVYGYACVPPTPFLLKDWERYDVSRFVDPGAVSPEEGLRTTAVDPAELRHSTIARDLDSLVDRDTGERAVLLAHAPPHGTLLDLADLAGQQVDGVPLDPHVGSIAVRRFIETRQPWLALHGHVHESARLTGAWRDRLGTTHLLSAAHDGRELALVRFPLEDPAAASRELIPTA